MFRIIILFVLIGIISSCSPRKKKDSIDRSFQSDLAGKYESALNFFGAEKTAHFPQTPDFTRYNFTESFSPIMGNLELILWRRESDTVHTDIPAVPIDETIAHYYADDTCLLIVNRFINRKDLHNVRPSKKDMRLVDRECYIDKYPIPNFWHNDYTNDVTNCRLPKDFEIYVMEAKAGQHFNEEYLTDGQYMPKAWRNGYSKGFAINKKRNIIIYWLIIW